MKIAGPGKWFVGAGAGTAALCWLGYRYFSCRPLGQSGLAALLFAGFCAYFFRDPERAIPAGPDQIVSPADGTVLSVRREGPADVVTLRIFLALWNVHVQRAPISGSVSKIQYQRGRFAMAMRPEAVQNERNSIRINGENGRFAIVEQIAGYVARRIACWIREGQPVSAGERIGMIYFGSQVAVHLPGTARVLVGPGQNVRGGLTVVGEYKKEPGASSTKPDETVG